jgi:bifunctional enzyme CysN/CysC
MELLTFATAGSVDDGKSTLIGRLLYDCKAIAEDQLDGVERASRRYGDAVNLALLTDGLRAEREQGITIDVAYRYFATPRRKFVIADSPGHTQYTRNMVCGASVADLAVVLVDARCGMTEQSRRHAFLLALLGVPHLVLAVNKMDLVGYSEAAFKRVRDACTDFVTRLPISDLTVVPISALHGDNIVQRSDPRMPWYDGPTLLGHLEQVHIASDRNLIDARLPVQYVLRPRSDAFHDYRGYAGQLTGGVLRTGDDVVVLPSGLSSRIVAIDTPDGPADEAFCPMSVALRLADDLDIARGDMICRPGNRPMVARDLDAMLCWMDDASLTPGAKLLMKHTSRCVPVIVRKIDYRIDVNTLHRQQASGLNLNEIGRVQLRTTRPVMCDPYLRNRATGGFILIDHLSNRTVAGGTINGTFDSSSGGAVER